jgi:hypothetical protein
VAVGAREAPHHPPCHLLQRSHQRRVLSLPAARLGLEIYLALLLQRPEGLHDIELAPQRRELGHVEDPATLEPRTTELLLHFEDQPDLRRRFHFQIKFSCRGVAGQELLARKWNGPRVLVEEISA